MQHLHSQQRSAVASLLDALHDLPSTLSLLLRRGLLTACQAMPLPTPGGCTAACLETQARHVLFFDGGSRGNPGPGGSGAVILRTTDEALTFDVVWSCAVYHAASTTTNNDAEYAGLNAGLQAARTNSWHPLEVVGDSALIIRQLRDYRPPKNTRLLAAYERARRVADLMDVQWWHHHYRSCNRAANAAANLAMDLRTSISCRHPTTDPRWAPLRHLALDDFAEWQASFTARTTP